MVSRGDFRPDLYFRLKVLSLDIPPLRERLDDVAPLFEHFAVLTARRYGMPAPTLSPELLDAARLHDWPGNVRELAHTVERAILLGGDRRLDAHSLGLAPAPVAAGGKPEDVLDGLTLDEAERRLIVRALRETDGNVSESARPAWRVPNGASLPNSEVRTRAAAGDSQRFERVRTCSAGASAVREMTGVAKTAYCRRPTGEGIGVRIARLRGSVGRISRRRNPTSGAPRPCFMSDYAALIRPTGLPGPESIDSHNLVQFVDPAIISSLTDHQCRRGWRTLESCVVVRGRPAA